jgi:DinB family protein
LSCEGWAADTGVVPENPIQTVDGEPLSAESAQLLEYLHSRAASLGPAGIRDRVRAAAHEFESAAASVTEAEARRRTIPGKWTIAEIVDHMAQTQIRSAEELRHLLAGKRPPSPPVYEGLRSGAPDWVPWSELLDGLRAANTELVSLLAGAADAPEPKAATVPAVLVMGPQKFVAELGWREYALACRLHLIDHRTQIKKLREAAAAV